MKKIKSKGHNNDRNTGYIILHTSKINKYEFNFNKEIDNVASKLNHTTF